MHELKPKPEPKPEPKPIEDIENGNKRKAIDKR